MNGTLVLRHALELAVLIPAAFFALLPVRWDLRYSVRRLILAAAVMILAYIAIFAPLCADQNWNSNWILFPLAIPFFAVYWFSVDLSAAKKCFCFFNAVMAITFSTMYTNFLCAPLELGYEDGPFSVRSGLICLGVDLVLCLFFFRTLYTKLPLLLEEERLDSVWRYMLFVPLGLTALLYWMSPLSPEVVMTGRVRPVALAAMALLPLTIFLLYHIFWQTTVLVTEGSRLQQENDLLRMERKRYEQLRNYLNETRTLRHDFRQHILVLDRLAQSGQTEKLTDYLRQFTESVEAGQEHYCANAAVDAVAASYADRAVSGGVKVSWHIDLPETLPIGEAEYCAVLGNLLENSLRAVSELNEERRRIRVISRMLSDVMLGLSVENPYEGTVKRNKQGLPKPKRSDHGIGLTSVAATVKRYGGTLDIQTERGLFIVNILLYSHQEQSEANEIDTKTGR